MGKLKSKYGSHNKEIERLFKEGHSQRAITRAILGESHGEEFDRVRGYVRHYLKSNGIAPDTFRETLEENKFDFPSNWEYGWLKTKGASIFVRNQNGEVSFEDMRSEFINAVKAYSPNFTKIARTDVTDPHLLVVDIADLHIGKLGVDSETGDGYNADLAITRAVQGVEGIINKASGFPIDKVLFVVGNDVLHVDGESNTTTRGTRQDTSGMWFENYKRAREMYVRVIEMLLTIADVHVVHNPSNHDYVTGFMLADSLHSWYRNSENVTFDVGMAHRKYYKYGENLIATSHGDGANMDTLPLIMANEAKMEWATTEWHYIYLHHIHHKKQFKFMSGKDYHGVTVEYLRSPSGTDSWHHREGYQHAPKAIEAFIHHKEYGQVARLTHLFK